MPHDGQTMPSILLDDLLSLTQAALTPVQDALAQAKDSMRARVAPAGKVDAALLEVDQYAAHGLAWLATYVESLRQMQGWAERLQADGHFGEMERLIHQIGFGEYLNQIAGGIAMTQGEVARLSDMGVHVDLDSGAAALLRAQGNSDGARMRLVALMRQNHGRATFGTTGLDEDLEMIRDQFRRYAEEQVTPMPMTGT